MVDIKNYTLSIGNITMTANIEAKIINYINILLDKSLSRKENKEASLAI
jgi:hypothetical protein